MELLAPAGGPEQGQTWLNLAGTEIFRDFRDGFQRRGQGKVGQDALQRMADFEGAGQIPGGQGSLQLLRPQIRQGFAHHFQIKGFIVDASPDTVLHVRPKIPKRVHCQHDSVPPVFIIVSNTQNIPHIRGEVNYS